MGADRPQPELDAAWLRDLAARLAGETRADDLAQDTLAAALRARSPRGDRRAWLAGILRNLVRMERRREARRRRRESFAALLAARREGVQGAAEAAARAEVRQVLAEAIARLPAAYRATLDLHFGDGRSCVEIARMHGVAPSTTRNRLRRALLRLRERLHPCFGGDPRPLVMAPLALGRRLLGRFAPGGRLLRRAAWLRAPLAATLLCGAAWAGAESAAAGPDPRTPASRPAAPPSGAPRERPGSRAVPADARAAPPHPLFLVQP